MIFSPTGRVLAPVFLVASALLPKDGVGVDLCLMHNLTGLSCPGCGLTRSITCMTHGDLSSAATYHPFGPILWVLLVALTVYSLVPARLRRSITAAAVRNDFWIRPGYRLFVTTFLGFGLLRFALETVARGGSLMG